MGMDSVELVMAVEEAFGIAISDQDASTAKTAGDLRDLILRALRNQNIQTNADQVWLKLKDIIADQLGVSPHQVTPETDFIRDLGVD
ncbi:phosphopantetheine-binding protein [Verrucomicrobium spinosum]|uniref:phosphopantetheine-binding protein n=1 Tax=Verrucomicrobium spinosum TaxID=2736 RepID=UPI0001744D60|nr:phosphopantetheine-binding protein [Verrucomicrobium spinosum]